MARPWQSRAFVSPLPLTLRPPWMRTTLRRHCDLPAARARVARMRTRAPTMLFDALADKMGETVRKMRGVDKITEKNVTGALKEVKRAMLDADVNLRVVNKLIKQIKARAVGADVLPGIEPGQMLVKIMHEELTEIMGKDQAPLAKRTDGQPTVILLAGLQGAGKTTAAAKLALYCKQDDRKVMLVAADVYRPAAIDQLRVLADMVEVDVFSLGTDVNPREIVRRGVDAAKEANCDTVIVDTAGRQVIDEKLMKELRDVKDICRADETLLVVDAMTGQEAATLARSFNEDVGISGAVLTKMDGDTRGGAALSVQQVSGAPVKFIGVGEKVAKLEAFFPERMASRILGMGDVVSLVEKAQEEMDQADAERMTKKMMEAKFDFNDFLKQTKMLGAMGSLGGVMKMLPGVGQISGSKMAEAEAKLKVADSLIKSMTPSERGSPELLFSGRSARSRMSRIAQGAGRSAKEAEDMVKDFEKMRSMMQRMSQQMAGAQAGAPGVEGGAASVGAGMGNRSQRRKAGKKKGAKPAAKRGFG